MKILNALANYKNSNNQNLKEELDEMLDENPFKKFNKKEHLKILASFNPFKSSVKHCLVQEKLNKPRTREYEFDKEYFTPKILNRMLSFLYTHEHFYHLVITYKSKQVFKDLHEYLDDELEEFGARTFAYNCGTKRGSTKDEGNRHKLKAHSHSIIFSKTPILWGLVNNSLMSKFEGLDIVVVVGYKFDGLIDYIFDGHHIYKGAHFHNIKTPRGYKRGKYKRDETSKKKKPTPIKPKNGLSSPIYLEGVKGFGSASSIKWLIKSLRVSRLII